MNIKLLLFSTLLSLSGLSVAVGNQHWDFQNTQRWIGDSAEGSTDYCSEKSMRWTNPQLGFDINQDSVDDFMMPISCYQGEAADGAKHNLKVRAAWKMYCSNEGQHYDCTSELFGSEVIEATAVADDISLGSDGGGNPYIHVSEAPRDLNNDGYPEFWYAVNRDDGRYYFDDAITEDRELLEKYCGPPETNTYTWDCTRKSIQTMLISRPDGTYQIVKLPWGAQNTQAVLILPNTIGTFDVWGMIYGPHKVARFENNSFTDVTAEYEQDPLWITIGEDGGPYAKAFEIDGSFYIARADIPAGYRPSWAENVVNSGFMLWKYIPGEGFSVSDVYTPAQDKIFEFKIKQGESTQVRYGAMVKDVPVFDPRWHFFDLEILDDSKEPVLMVQSEAFTQVGSSYKAPHNSNTTYEIGDLDAAQNTDDKIYGGHSAIEGFFIRDGKLIPREKAIIAGNGLYDIAFKRFVDINSDGYLDIIVSSGGTPGLPSVYLNDGKGMFEKLFLGDIFPDLYDEQYWQVDSHNVHGWGASVYPFNESNSLDLLFWTKGFVNNIPTYAGDDFVFSPGDIALAKASQDISVLNVFSPAEQHVLLEKCYSSGWMNRNGYQLPCRMGIPFPDETEIDTDGDGIVDSEDDLRFNSSESVDTDNDGIGNNADTDDDNDGATDNYELLNGTDPLLTDSDNDDIDDGNDTDANGDGLVDWIGNQYREEDPDQATGRFAEINYRRSNLSELQAKHPEYPFAGNSEFQRNNVGVLEISNSSYVLAHDGGFEQNDEGNTNSIDPGPSPMTGDFNNDGLTDIVFAHSFGPNNASWLPRTKVIVLVNQGDGTLQVDPNIFASGEAPLAGPMFVSHVEDFNGDGIDDFINIGEDGTFLLSSPSGLIDQSIELKNQMFEMGTYDQDENYTIWTHTTAAGDLDGNGTIDMLVPAGLRDQDCAARYGCSGFTMLNDGSGNFSLGSIKLPYMGSVYASAISDFDNDGYADIAISMPPVGEDNVFYDLRLCDTCSGAILYGNSDFDYTRDIVVLPNYSIEHSLGLQFLTIDFDEDGHKDLFLVGTGNGYGEGYGGGDNYYDEIYVQVFTHNVSGRSWTDSSTEYIDYSNYNNLPKHPNGGSKPDWYRQIDIDNDGDLDLWSQVDPYAPYFINNNGVFSFEGSIGELLPSPLGCSADAVNGCWQHTQTHVAVKLDQNETYDFIQAHQWGDSETNGLTLSQLIAIDSDSDGKANAFDSDDDNDNVLDGDDAFPLDATETIDTDGDGIGNNADTDDDGDGVLDENDDAPLNPSNDSDDDGVANNIDKFPENVLYSADSDSDGMPDAWETLYGLDPNDASDATSDQDNDGVTALEEFLAGTIPSGSLDIDGNENYDALTDGLLLLRGMFGLDGNALVSGTIASDAAYTESVDIESRIETLGDLADIDGNGEIDALTDGLLTLRYLFGLEGDTLIDGVVAGNATRKTAEEIEAHLETLMPAL